MTLDKRKALGRGLSALLPQAPSPGSAQGSGRRTFFEVGIEDVFPTSDNPRKHFDNTALGELAASIRAQGLAQPLVVRQRPEGGFYLIAGERRWRAAQQAGLKQVPVVVKELSQKEAFELALVENLQRQDLNPLEEAEAYQRLTTGHGYTQEQIAERVGKERATVANALRLLKLPAAVRARMIAGELQMGHARALLGLEEGPAIERAAARVVKQQLSVRQTEALVRKERTGKPTGKPPLVITQSPAVRDLQSRLERSLGTKVRIAQKDAKQGTLQIDYHSLDQLDGILGRLLR